MSKPAAAQVQRTAPPATLSASRPDSRESPRAATRRWKRLLGLPDDPSAPLLSPGPLRTTGPAAAQAPKGPAAIPTALADQGVVGLQLRQVGRQSEVHLRWQEQGQTVEACLRETAHGVEIRLTGSGPSTLAQRVAETLSATRAEHAFALDDVEVHAQGDLSDPRGRRPHEPEDDDLPARPRHRRRAAQIPSPGASRTSGYSR